MNPAIPIKSPFADAEESIVSLGHNARPPIIQAAPYQPMLVLGPLPPAFASELIHPKAVNEIALKRIDEKLAKLEQVLNTASDMQARLIRQRVSVINALRGYAEVIADE